MGLAFGEPDDRLRDEQSSNYSIRVLDCFAFARNEDFVGLYLSGYIYD
jgi:hypothetical protein